MASAKAQHKLTFLNPFPSQAGPFLTVARDIFPCLQGVTGATGHKGCPLRDVASNCPVLWGQTLCASKPQQFREALGALAENCVRKRISAFLEGGAACGTPFRDCGHKGTPEQTADTP